MLRVTRQNAGHQQKHAAELMGISVITLCKWENERKMPGGASLIKLCILYNKTVKELYPLYYGQMEEELIKKQSNDPDGDMSCQQ